MMPVAITGIGVITPLGDSPSALAEALLAGRSAVIPVPDPDGAVAAPLPDFDANRYARVRGMRIYSRATRLAMCATQLALTDAGLDGGDGKHLGLVASFSSAHLETLIEYDRSLVTRGTQQTNPALMPLGLPSAPGAVIAIAFSAQAFCVTLSDGGVGGLDALGLAARLLAEGRAKACIVVSASALCDELALSAWRAGLLARHGDFSVFDRRSHGTAFGEAGVALVLEPLEEARQRGARSKGALLAQSSRFGMPSYIMALALDRAAQTSLELSETDVSDLALVSSGANGISTVDRVEAQALLQVLGEHASHTPVIAVKASLGETVEASGLLQTIVALHALAARKAPFIVGLQTPAVPGLDYADEVRKLRDGRALVTCTSATGACSAIVVSADV
jgi:3-oxoacyl-[acyl-carrier-protein] synthase II